MSDVRAHVGAPTTAQFAGIIAPSACAPLIVDSMTGAIYALKSGDVVTEPGAVFVSYNDELILYDDSMVIL